MIVYLDLKVYKFYKKIIKRFIIYMKSLKSFKVQIQKIKDELKDFVKKEVNRFLDFNKLFAKIKFLNNHDLDIKQNKKEHIINKKYMNNI